MNDKLYHSLIHSELKRYCKNLVEEINERTQEKIRSHTLPKPRLSIISCAPNFATQKYLAIKKRQATKAGVEVDIIELPKDARTSDLVEAVLEAVRRVDGVLVQLPLPAQIDREEVLAAIPVSHDPDGFHYGSDPDASISPVVRAIIEIGHYHERYLNVYEDESGNITYRLSPETKVLIVGQGRLVGLPAAYFFRSVGAEVVVITEETPEEDRRALFAKADIIITGVGKPWFITPSMVKEEAYIFDAGTSEEGGEQKGDVHPMVADVVSFLTPVPGGIGPVAVAALFENLVDLMIRRQADANML